MKSKSSGFSNLFRKGLAANRKESEETKKKAEELQTSKTYYRSTQSTAKELAKMGQQLCEAELALSSLLKQFVVEGVSDNERSKDLQQLCDGFSDRLKKLSSLRHQVNDKIESSFVTRMQTLLDDDELSKTRTRRHIPAELEYQLARRDLDGTEAVREMAYSYLCYFETGAALMKEMKVKMEALETKYVEHQPLIRQEFIDAEESDTPSMPNPDLKVFEMSLSQLLERPTEPGPIPVMMNDVMTFIESNYMDREGIFRVPGATSEVKRLKDRIDSGQDVDFETENIANKEHTICAFMKAFFRDLPDPLLTFEKFDEFVSVAKMVDKEEQKAKLHALVNSLPQPNFSLLGRLMQLFKAVVDNQSQTKMNSQNIAISFGMNLMRMPAEDPMKLATSTTAINKTCELLINYCSDFFPEKITLNEVQVDASSAESGSAMPITKPTQEWQEFFDETTQKCYYHNPATGETSWTKPTTSMAQV